MSDVVEALRLGAWDYLTKPIPDLGILEHAVAKAVERANLSKERERYREHLEEEIAKRTEELEKELAQRKSAEERAQESVVKLKRMLDEIVQALAGVVQIKDPYTSGHQRRVVQLATLIGQEMGLSPPRVDAIRVSGLLHDIGKIYVPAEILSKPGQLSDPERKIIQSHCQVGFDLLRGISFEWPVAQIVLQHHEQLDGSGYPQGLKGGEILIEARVLRVADVVEALSSHRPYRPAFGVEFALAEIASLGGTSFDPEVVEACLTLFREKTFSFL
jgi:putative nucleotidyltransferase with HDIG domain